MSWVCTEAGAELYHWQDTTLWWSMALREGLVHLIVCSLLSELFVSLFKISLSRFHYTCALILFSCTVLSYPSLLKSLFFPVLFYVFLFVPHCISLVFPMWTFVLKIVAPEFTILYLYHLKTYPWSRKMSVSRGSWRTKEQGLDDLCLQVTVWKEKKGRYQNTGFLLSLLSRFFPVNLQ